MEKYVSEMCVCYLKEKFIMILLSEGVMSIEGVIGAEKPIYF